jgi:hypothetical protein
MPRGAGLAPAGFSPAGFGAVDIGAPNNQSPLPDPKTGLPQANRLINAVTGDYTFTADGRVAGMTAQQQNVLLALLNGNIFAGLYDKGDGFQRKIANRVQTALNPYIRPGWIALLGVDVVEPGSGSPDAAGIYVKWQDLTMPAPGSNTNSSPNTFTTVIPTT